MPQSDVYSTRLTVSAAGLPSSSQTGFPLLDKAGVTTSDFQQQIDYQSDLESQLDRTIDSLNGVQSAAVTLAIPQQNVFTDSNSKPTAGVLLTVAGGTTLTTSQVQSVVYLVSSSVPGMSADDVTVTDSNGNVLNAPGQGVTSATSATTQNQATQALDARLASPAAEHAGHRARPGQRPGRGQRDARLRLDQHREQELRLQQGRPAGLAVDDVGDLHRHRHHPRAGPSARPTPTPTRPDDDDRYDRHDDRPSRRATAPTRRPRTRSTTRSAPRPPRRRRRRARSSSWPSACCSTSRPRTSTPAKIESMVKARRRVQRDARRHHLGDGDAVQHRSAAGGHGRDQARHQGGGRERLAEQADVDGQAGPARPAGRRPRRRRVAGQSQAAQEPGRRLGARTPSATTAPTATPTCRRPAPADPITTPDFNELATQRRGLVAVADNRPQEFAQALSGWLNTQGDLMTVTELPDRYAPTPARPARRADRSAEGGRAHPAAGTRRIGARARALQRERPRGPLDRDRPDRHRAARGVGRRGRRVRRAARATARRSAHGRYRRRA